MEQETKQYELYYNQSQYMIGGMKLPRVTVTGIVEQREKSLTIKFGFARCTASDQYSRVTGRRLSSYRAANDPQLMIGVKQDTAEHLFMLIASQMAHEVMKHSHLGQQLLTPIPDEIAHPAKQVRVKVKYTPEQIEKLRQESLIKKENAAIDSFDSGVDWDIEKKPQLSSEELLELDRELGVQL